MYSKYFNLTIRVLNNNNNNNNRITQRVTVEIIGVFSESIFLVKLDRRFCDVSAGVTELNDIPVSACICCDSTPTIRVRAVARYFCRRRSGPIVIQV